MRRTTHRFVGYALTPVHIGDGTEMTPDGYRLGDGATLERFDPPAVIAAISNDLRRQYIDALSKGSLSEAQKILSRAATGTLITERLAISAYSSKSIEEALSNPLRRRGTISPFVRSGGTPILPGSSVKGALRTAWLARAIESFPPEDIARIGDSIEAEGLGGTGENFDSIQRAAFDMERGRTEHDPLRDIAVSDARLERESTVIDRVHVAKCTHEGPVAIGDEGKMQIHVERLASLADRGAFAAKPFRIDIAALDAQALRERHERAGLRAKGAHEISRALPASPPGLDDLRNATNAHHAALWFYERQRFYRGTKTASLLDELLRAFKLPVQREPFEAAADAAGVWLLKLGRYGHFESKSIEIDGRRFGQKAKREGHPARFMSEGGSRTVARDAEGRLLPFGWVLLFPEARAPKPRPFVRQEELPPFRFRKGDRVTNAEEEEEAKVYRDVRHTDTKMEIQYDDGDIREVSVTGWSSAR